VSKRIDANYVIMKLTHRIGSSGYEMEGDVVSNVGQAIRRTQAALGVQLEPHGSVNTEEVDEEAPGTTNVPPSNPN